VETDQASLGQGVGLVLVLGLMRNGDKERCGCVFVPFKYAIKFAN
jgi:hypothetical protein